MLRGVAWLVLVLGVEDGRDGGRVGNLPRIMGDPVAALVLSRIRRFKQTTVHALFIEASITFLPSHNMLHNLLIHTRMSLLMNNVGCTPTMCQSRVSQRVTYRMRAFASSNLVSYSNTQEVCCVQVGQPASLRTC